MPAFYVPARDSRHRVACFALYRALLRQVPCITLPADLTTPARPEWIHPILYLIRSGFRRNRRDTSKRLITSAFKSGYRFLSVLTRAHDPSSPAYGEVVSFLRERQANFPPAPPAPTEEEAKEQTREEEKKERFTPIFTKISPPDAETPVYEASLRPLPLSMLTGGKRKVPQVETANSFSFLRIQKPQSHYLSMVLHRKNAMRQKRITHMIELQEETLHEWRWEDKWDDMMELLAVKEGVDLIEGESQHNHQQQQSGDRQGDGSVDWMDPEHNEFPARNVDSKSGEKRNTHEQTCWEYGYQHVKQQLEAEAKDIMARTQAMVNLVREEKRLAEEEKAQNKEMRRRAWEERMEAEG